jgi:hypothetical protein
MAIDRRPFFDKHRETRMERHGREFNPRFAEGAYGTDKELHSLFMRTRRDVDYQGAFTPQEIDNRLREAVAELRYLAKRGYLNPEKACDAADNLEKLIGTNFAHSILAMAKRHPYGPENLTLHYGRKGAMDIILERDRKLRRMVRTRRD